MKKNEITNSLRTGFFFFVFLICLIIVYYYFHLLRRIWKIVVRQNSQRKFVAKHIGWV